jgi:hypothetical protein
VEATQENPSPDKPEASNKSAEAPVDPSAEGSSANTSLSEISSDDANRRHAATGPGDQDAMEIHHPEKPIHNKKDFIIHMLTVVLGILIALGFEAIVQWGHHRALVREARANLAAEIAINRKALNDGLPEIMARKEKLRQILGFLLQIGKGKTLHGTFSFGWTGFDLYATAWKTAETSGATAYMSYDNLKDYTELYDLQQVFESFQTDAFHANTDLSALPLIMTQDPKKVPPVMLGELEAAVTKAMTVNDAVAVAATQLKKQYDTFQAR